MHPYLSSSPSPFPRNGSAADLLDEQAALKQQLERASQALKQRQAERAARGAALEEVRARLEAAAAQQAELQRRVEAAQKQKVGGWVGGGCAGW